MCGYAKSCVVMQSHVWLCKVMCGYAKELNSFASTTLKNVAARKAVENVWLDFCAMKCQIYTLLSQDMLNQSRSISDFHAIMKDSLNDMKTRAPIFKVVSRARPFTDSCPPGRKRLVTLAHTFGDFPHDSWGTVLPCIAYRELCFFYTSVICSRIN